LRRLLAQAHSFLHPRDILRSHLEVLLIVRLREFCHSR
jgi:hypothetical protein